MAKRQSVAIVHDWLVGGGAEKVVLELHRLYPEAPIYTSYATDEWREKLDGKVVTGWLQYFGKVRKFIPFLRIWWFTSLNLDKYDLVISSSGAEAKGIVTKLGTMHINYCHAPTHYYWSRYDEYLKNPGFGALNGLARIGLRLLVGPLRKWDYRAAQRPDLIIANSTHTAEQIKRYYNRDSEVIHPPVDVNRFKNSSSVKRTGFVISGRQVPYKRVDLAVGACSKAEVPLAVLGDGPEHETLRKIAGPTITFLGRVSDEELVDQIASAEAYLFPGIDDFGIAAVEALAAGTPVIAFHGGGARDYIIPGKTGEFFTEQTIESLEKTLTSFDSRKYNSKIIKEFANTFSGEVFSKKMEEFITQHS